MIVVNSIGAVSWAFLTAEAIAGYFGWISYETPMPLVIAAFGCISMYFVGKIFEGDE